MNTYEFDVVIIGGGPAGCTCALYTSRADHKTVILDKNDAVGALAITHKIANYPGVPRDISGAELLKEMRDQAISYGTTYQRAQVFSIDIEVAVVGINQEAIEEAQFLTKFASTVNWITFKEPKPENAYAQNLLSTPNVKHWPGTRLMSVEGNGMGVTGVKLKQKGTEDPLILDLEGVFIYQNGSKPITDFIGDLVEYNPDGGVKVDETMATNVEGVWAIGDIRNTPYKQAVVAAGDGCIAAMSIDRFLNHRKSIKTDWDHS